MTLLPVLGPGVAEGFAAGMLVCAACLVIVIALQRAGRQEAGLLRSWRELSRPGTSRWRRAAARLAGRTLRTWPVKAAVPPTDTEDARSRPPPRRRGGKHAARLFESPGIGGRRRSRVLAMGTGSVPADRSNAEA